VPAQAPQLALFAGPSTYALMLSQPRRAALTSLVARAAELMPDLNVETMGRAQESRFNWRLSDDFLKVSILRKLFREVSNRAHLTLSVTVNF
jgi:hypothetical protein